MLKRFYWLCNGASTSSATLSLPLPSSPLPSSAFSNCASAVDNFGGFSAYGGFVSLDAALGGRSLVARLPGGAALLSLLYKAMPLSLSINFHYRLLTFATLTWSFSVAFLYSRWFALYLYVLIMRACVVLFFPLCPCAVSWCKYNFVTVFSQRTLGGSGRFWWPRNCVFKEHTLCRAYAELRATSHWYSTCELKKIRRYAMHYCCRFAGSHKGQALMRLLCKDDKYRSALVHFALFNDLAAAKFDLIYIQKCEGESSLLVLYNSLLPSPV